MLQQIACAGIPWHGQGTLASPSITKEMQVLMTSFHSAQHI